jgi:GNAT superfamily N-acetyltransferase
MPGKLTFKPVTAATVGDFEALFSAKGGPNWCWCMAWRATSAELKDAKSPARKQQMLDRIADGVPVGLVACDKGRPVAWVSVAPKDTFQPGLGGVKETDKVWSLTCMFIAKEYRKRGLSALLIEAAAKHAKKHKATILEAYPVDPDSPSYRHMGFVPAFKRAGFEADGREGTRRHVMHLALDR